MRQKTNICILVALAALLCSGCFDLESEIKVLPDGSGFVTVWARVSTRLASINSGLEGLDLEQSKKNVVANLDRIFTDQEGIELVERVVYQDGEESVLRYRYLFENTKALNRFWSQPENAVQAITLYRAKASLVATGSGCQARYEFKIAFHARPENQIYDLRGTAFADQPIAVQRHLVDEYYKGRFRLRIVLPGRPDQEEADLLDLAGHPIWETNILGLYRDGLEAQARSHAECDDDGQARPLQQNESYPQPSIPLSEGPRPGINDVLFSLNSLDELVTIEIEMEVARRSSMQITYRIDPRVAAPVKSMLTLQLATMPTVSSDWEMTTGRDESGRFVLRLKTKRPLRLDNTDSPFLYAGSDGEQCIFRLRLPQLSFDLNRPPEVPGRVLLKVKVTMPTDVHTSNATFVHGETAEWLLTTRDLSVPVILEAICAE